MPSEEKVFTPRETKLAVWVVAGALALTAAGLTARQMILTPQIEQAERVSLADIPEARPLLGEVRL